MAEKEWWEESSEEFANGFTEEVHTHHAESEIKPVAINQNSNEAMAALYGPAAKHSEYSRFTKIRYRDEGRNKTGLIIWITEATPDSPMLYVVEPAQGGFPEWIAGGDITGVVE